MRTAYCVISELTQHALRISLLPAARRESFRFGQRLNRAAHHRLAQILADFGDDARVTEVRRRLDNGLRAVRRVATLEDTRPDEHTIDTQLHHQRRVGGRGDAAGRKVDHRQAAQFARLDDEFLRRADLFGKRHHFFHGHALQLADLAIDRSGVADRFNYVARARFALGAHHRGAFADAA